jgi:hypothetical protein
MKKTLEENMNEALDSIEKDRTYAEELLKDVINEISKSGNSHQYIGTVAAKYLETMQRSNEQRVKLIALQYKSGPSLEEDIEFSEKETDSIYDQLQKEQDDAK